MTEEAKSDKIKAFFTTAMKESLSAKPTGYIVVDVRYRFPAASLQPIDVDEAIANVQALLSLNPHSITGYATTGERADGEELSTGYQQVVQGKTCD